MNFFGKLFDWNGGKKQRDLRKLQRSFKNYVSSINAANGGSGRGGRGIWMGMPDDEDAANKEYANDRAAVMQRAQDLDVNNPDIGGFHRARTAQIAGAGVRFKHCALAEELGLTEAEMTAISEKIDRLRKLHSENGGFDAQKGLRWEGMRQEQGLITMFVYGQCLIHRVGRSRKGVIPLSIELIPGIRISTPYDKYGDPRVSFGVRYTDEHRTEVTGYYVRRVSKTIGNSFVPDFDWDFLPIEDCALLELTEAAGIDQALPLCTRVMRMLRNRGEFMQNTLESLRAQSSHYAVIKCAPNVDPWALAQDDQDSSEQTSSSGKNVGFIDMGDGVRVMYSMNGEEVTWSSAKLPEPNFAQFWDKSDEVCSRGVNSSKSRFTRVVNSSWAGGRLEDQQDDPIIAQYCLKLLAAWHIVDGWFLEAVWLTNAIDLPGYSNATKIYWNQFTAEFPEKVEVNQADTAAANETNLMLRKTTPQKLIEKTGSDARTVLRQWAKWMVMTREEEKRAGLEAGSLSILFRGKAVTSDAGDDIGAPTPAAEPEPGEEGGGGGK